MKKKCQFLEKKKGGAEPLLAALPRQKAKNRAKKPSEGEATRKRVHPQEVTKKVLAKEWGSSSPKTSMFTTTTMPE